ncbi:MAG: TIGR00341 family protein, partial [Prevotella pallens]|nr:TIGR00341 family protein [Prevotella pallens]
MDPNNNQTLWQVVKKYFNVMPDKASEDNVIAQITEGVDFHGATLWILILAIFIASLGLNVNSTAVIIGAMLISPLMGPIIGM